MYVFKKHKEKDMYTHLYMIATNLRAYALTFYHYGISITISARDDNQLTEFLPFPVVSLSSSARDGVSAEYGGRARS